MCLCIMCQALGRIQLDFRWLDALNPAQLSLCDSVVAVTLVEGDR